jgi:hypothetical protein
LQVSSANTYYAAYFGNRFPWEISPEINRPLIVLLLNLPDRKCIYQGPGDPNALL